MESESQLETPGSDIQAQKPSNINGAPSLVVDPLKSASRRIFFLAIGTISLLLIATAAYLVSLSGTKVALQAPEVVKNILAPIATQDVALLPGWEKYTYEKLGIAFQLPEGWEQVHPEAPDAFFTLVFAPKSAQYSTRPRADYLTINIWENPERTPYGELLYSERPDLQEGYLRAEKRIVGGRPARILYEHEFPTLGTKEDPIVVVEFDDRYVDIILPTSDLFLVKEMQELPEAPTLDMLLSTFQFSTPDASKTNTSHPSQQPPVSDLIAWCANAPVPGQCYSELARKEGVPNISWCEAITLENSRHQAFYESYRNACYRYAAAKLKDISSCDHMIGNASTKSYATLTCQAWVNYELAVEKKDVSYCRQIDVSTSYSDGYGMDTISYQNCFVAVALHTDDPKLCEQIVPQKAGSGAVSSKEWCLFEYAVGKGDCSLVPENSPASKSQCEWQVKEQL